MMPDQGCIAPMPLVGDSVDMEEHEKYTKRCARNEQRDMKNALNMFYRFSGKLKELHPRCQNLIYNMIQQGGI